MSTVRPQHFIIREFLSRSELLEEFEVAKNLQKMEVPADALLSSTDEELQISEELAEALTTLLSKRWRKKPLYLLKTTTRLLEGAETEEEKYLRFCDSAICQTIAGDADQAEACLLEAAAIDDQRPLHHHIYALLHGLRGESGKALFELHLAIERGPEEETLPRIFHTQKHFTQELSN